ncbi:MAG: AAA family ATPase [Nitrospinae bacterium]|nr:AAA family ATPase [Nitrospinota bacterium]
MGEIKDALKKAELIAFANHKGGTGKTTSCISIAGFLAKEGYKVLVVDFDPQANATSGLGIDAMTLKHSIYDAILNKCNSSRGVPVIDVILETDFENMHLAPSESDLSAAEVIMQNTKNSTDILANILRNIRPFYNYILIDLPTSSGLLTINGLCALDHLVVPVDPSIYSLESLDNLKMTLTDIRKMTGHVFNKITVILIRFNKPKMFSKLSGRLSPSQEIEARLKERFQTVFTIPESIEIYKSQKEGIPLSHYAPDSDAGKAYKRITNKIIKEGGGSKRKEVERM